MKHKYISTKSSEILTYFIERGKECFAYAEAERALPQSSGSALRELLSDMVKRGLLMRLKKGLYCVIPYEKDPQTFMPDWHVIAKYLTVDTPYYVGYYSALQLHGLITQPSLKEQIVVAEQIRPSTLEVKDVSFQFIYHNENHFFGYETGWVDSFQKVNCSDLEKTIVDCLFKPNYAGGIVEIAKAIYTAQGNLDFEKLFNYSLRFKSQAVIKRLGFLLDVLEVETNILEKLNKARTRSYVLLDTELPKSGKMVSKWSIQQNLDSETIKSALYT